MMLRDSDSGESEKDMTDSDSGDESITKSKTEHNARPEAKDVFIGSPGSRAQPAFFSSSENIFKLKVVLIGDINVGKTSIAMRFSQDKYDGKYKQTIGGKLLKNQIKFLPKFVDIIIYIFPFQAPNG